MLAICTRALLCFRSVWHPIVVAERVPAAGYVGVSCACPIHLGWYVMARPEGKRVLVISSKGETVARQMSGAVIHR